MVPGRAAPALATAAPAALATAALLAAAAFPFVVLFPDPPAFGRQAVALFAAVPVVAAAATAWRAEPPGRARILRRAVLLLTVTAATAATSMVLRGGPPLVPTPDLLPALLRLRGEDIDAAVLFEAWVEMWLAWALLLGLAARLLLPPPRPIPLPGPWHRPAPPGRPWNPATILLFAVGWAALAGAAVEGHGVAAFARRAVHADGTVASDEGHPLVRFTAPDGREVMFRQNGGLWRSPGDPVPVAFDPADPGGTARADTLFTRWGEAAGLAWIGLGFTLFPFFGFRAAFGQR